MAKRKAIPRPKKRNPARALIVNPRASKARSAAAKKAWRTRKRKATARTAAARKAAATRRRGTAKPRKRAIRRPTVVYSRPAKYRKRRNTRFDVFAKALAGTVGFLTAEFVGGKVLSYMASSPSLMKYADKAVYVSIATKLILAWLVWTKGSRLKIPIAIGRTAAIGVGISGIKQLVDTLIPQGIFGQAAFPNGGAAAGIMSREMGAMGAYSSAPLVGSQYSSQRYITSDSMGAVTSGRSMGARASRGSSLFHNPMAAY